MLMALRQLWPIIGEFIILMLAITVMSMAAAFGIFSTYGAVVTASALTFALVIPLITAALAFIYFAVRLLGLIADNDGLQRAAVTDRLTGALNRQGFNKEYLRLLAGNVKSDKGIMLLIIDADHFKKINDTLGHPAGDQALRLIASTLKRSLRATDVVGRLGGEEFCVAYPCATIDQGRLVAERLRRSVNVLSVGEGTTYRQISVSIGGVFSFGATRFDTAYAQADANLYQAKQAGRNRSILSPLRIRKSRRRMAEIAEEPISING